MASTKDLRKRIGSVKSTQQTTKAMKMVSAAKLRRAQEAIHQQRPYARRVGALIRFLSSLQETAAISPLIKKDRAQKQGEEGGSEQRKKKIFLVLVTSDRGLCGGFNSNVIKAAHHWMMESQSNYEVELGFVGKKAYDVYKRRKVNLGPHYSDLGGKVTFLKARKLSETLISKFLSEEVDEIKIIYNEFKNAMSQKVVVEDFLPLQGELLQVPAQSAENHSTEQETPPDVYLFKPSAEGVLRQLLEKNFAIQAFRILLESQAAEHGARMSSMENATKNADEMIRKLTLLYNKQRQAGITKELLEIIGGSESQKAS